MKAAPAAIVLVELTALIMIGPMLVQARHVHTQRVLIEALRNKSAAQERLIAALEDNRAEWKKRAELFEESFLRMKQQ